MIRSTLVTALTMSLFWATVPTLSAADEPPTPAPDTPTDGLSEQTRKINELIAAKWKEIGITKPADRTNDYEFMRRVFIDLLGRIPTYEEIIDFEQDRGANRRVRLVQRLLNESKYTPKKNGTLLKSIPSLSTIPIDYSRQYASNFAEVWSVWLLTRSGIDEIYREQFQSWLEDQLDANEPYTKFVSSLITATGKSNDNGAVHFVFRHLGDPLPAESRTQPVDHEKFGKYDNVPITSRVTKMFLGIRTQCTQCHDHPQAKEWLQKDFWGVNAFFKQTEKIGAQTAMRKATVTNYVQLTDEPAWNKEGLVLFDRRDGRRDAAYATMLKDLTQAENGETSSKKLTDASVQGGKTRRQVLAEWVLQHDNFEKAYVNRMWGHLFGRGLQKEPTVDDFRIENTVVHPELLSYLASEFKKYNHDMKKLLEWICTSDVYQLSHVASKEKIKRGDKFVSQTDVEFDPYFTRMPLKAQSPEAIFESLSIATRARARFDTGSFKTLKREWSNNLVKNFGDDEGNEANFNGTIVQALLMMNGKELNGQVSGNKDKSKDKRSVVGDVVAKYTRNGQTDVKSIYTELFLTTVSRRPTQEEVNKLDEVRKGQAKIKLTDAPKSKPVSVPGAASASDIAFYEDVFWALLNTNEFMLNH